MSREMKRSLINIIIFTVAGFFFTPLWVKIFCAFCVGVNFEVFIVSWRSINNN